MTQRVSNFIKENQSFDSEAYKKLTPVLKSAVEDVVSLVKERKWLWYYIIMNSGHQDWNTIYLNLDKHKKEKNDGKNNSGKIPRIT